jgi:hypothetical protein
MSRVYRAEQIALERKVALKVLLPELGQEQSYRERFLRESRLAASIEHSNIVPIYDAGEASGYLYIAMKLVEGLDLRALLGNGSGIAPAQALSLLQQAANALDAAHAHGLIHRDIKPANFLLAGDHLYLTDFGVARLGHAAGGMTRVGLFVGTIDYASPEQIRNEPLDERSDIYSLACVFYHCLTGTGPFDRPTEHAVLQAQLSETPASVRALRPELPAALDGVFATALAKDRNERFRSGRALATAARFALEGRAAEIPTRPTVIESLSRIAPIGPVPDNASSIGAAPQTRPHALHGQPTTGRLGHGRTPLIVGVTAVALLLGVGAASRSFSVSLPDILAALTGTPRGGTSGASASPDPLPLAAVEAAARSLGWPTHRVQYGESTFAIADAEGVSRTAFIDANVAYYPDIARTTPPVGALVIIPRSSAAAARTLTPSPVPTPRRVLLQASQFIMPPSEFPFAGYTVGEDYAWGSSGWHRRFVSTNGDYFNISINIYVLTPDRSGSTEVASETCDLNFTGPAQPVAREVSAAVIGDAAKACEYHFEGNIVDVQQYITATRNVEILVWGAPRWLSITNAQAMSQMVAIARQQIAITERVAPR